MQSSSNIMSKMLTASRYFVLLAVVGSLIASFATIVYGCTVTIRVIYDAFFKESIDTLGAKHLAIGFVEVIDLYLIGTVMYIFALGMYELFIDAKLPVPKWLEIKSISQLKLQLIGVLAVMIAVTFVGNVVDYDGTENILALGIGSSLMIIALAGLQWLTALKSTREAEGD